jgi:hypothetical protein
MHISECFARMTEVEDFKISVRNRHVTIHHLFQDCEVNIEHCRGAIRQKFLAAEVNF